MHTERFFCFLELLMMMCNWDRSQYNFNSTSNIETSAQLKVLLVVHFIFDCINDRDRFHAFNNTYEKKILFSFLFKSTMFMELTLTSTSFSSSFFYVSIFDLLDVKTYVLIQSFNRP
jgi:hypothetical protein